MHRNQIKSNQSNMSKKREKERKKQREISNWDTTNSVASAMKTAASFLASYLPSFQPTFSLIFFIFLDFIFPNIKFPKPFVRILSNLRSHFSTHRKWSFLQCLLPSLISTKLVSSISLNFFVIYIWCQKYP